MYFPSLKPLMKERTIEKWREHVRKIRNLLEGKDSDCRDLRNASRKIRYDLEVSKKWETYYNNLKLHDRKIEIELLIEYAETILPKIANEKKLIEDEKFQTETFLQKCDKWLTICIEGLNCLDKKLENEITRDDDATNEIKNEIELLENIKKRLKEDCILAWETLSSLEDVETKVSLNLEFKKDVLAIEERCLAIEKMDTGVSFKVEPTKGPDKMISIEDWTKVVYGLVEKGLAEIQKSRKLRERMSSTRGVSLNEYTIQFDKTDYEMRKRIYEINREKNESQYQCMKVEDLIKVTSAEIVRLEKFLIDVKNDLKCAETRCSDRYFRPSLEATADPPFHGLNKEVVNLKKNIETIESHLDALKTFRTKLETDYHKLQLECDAKNKSLQVQVQALDIRIAERYDPKKIYAYNPDALLSKMITQLPPPSHLYSYKF
ncbi:Tektin-B1, putative [Pediculus humanus corporis]|uniref:Tektin n=1 Tax=Pediculus humanus subsp. corporis TaxID=121224 RepID=E0VVW7_PEDHC|nr:Tektin-B1, putative [Pediculus humanus corporis]EEB17523.1 Tektin-B1, putative [Pediculus humanus corporis]